MKINNKKITAKEFAWDGCHKIYLINTDEDRDKFIELEYNLLPIDELQEIYDECSCSLRFISNADLIGDDIVSQFEDAKFTK